MLANWTTAAEVMSAAIISVLLPFARKYLNLRLARAFAQDVNGERARLRTEILPRSLLAATDLESRLTEIVGRIEATGAQSVSADTIREALASVARQAAVDRAAPADAQSENERFALLLIEYYAYGLAQAKRSLAASLAYSGLGGFVLIGGVVLALVHPSGGLTVPIVTSLSGVLSSGIGTLFHRQASQSLKHMESQSRSLRQDMKAERDQTQAIQLLGDVEDVALRSQLQAALILQFTGAKLPGEATRSARSARPVAVPAARGAANGQVPVDAEP